MGDYNSARGNQLVIRFEMCSGRDDCKTKSQIKEWIKRKFIITLGNMASFNKEKVEKLKLTKSS